MVTQHQFDRPHPSQPTEETKQLQVRILEMYRDNPNFLAISRELGYSVYYIRKQYKKALHAIIVPAVEDHRKLQLIRMDRLHEEAMRVLTTFHPVIAQGVIMRDVVEDEFGNVVREDTEEGLRPKYTRLKDSGPVLAAIDRILKIEERRAKLLGLDAPAKTALTNPAGDKEATSSVQFYIPTNNRDSNDTD